MSKTIYLEKHLIDNCIPYIDASDVTKYYKEYDEKYDELYVFAKIIEDLFNYWGEHTPTAFGNPDYSYLQGKYEGYIIAKGYREEETNSQIILYKGRRKVFIIDKIEKPQKYYDDVKDNKEILNTILGG